MAGELGLQEPSPLSPTGWFDDVDVVGNDIDVNADRSNVVDEFPRRGHHRW